MGADELLASTELASLAGIGRRNAAMALKSALEGHPWRGHYLDVHVAHGRGGASGKTYLVALPSLPHDLQKRYHEARLAANPDYRRRVDAKTAFRCRFVRRVRDLILDGEKPEEAIGQVCADPDYRYPCGKKAGKRVGYETARAWMRRWRGDGYGGMGRQERNDKGKAKVLVSRPWDAAARRECVPDAEQGELVCQIERVIKQEYQAGASSAPAVQLFILAEVMDWTRAAAPGIPEDELRELCRVPEHFIRKFSHHQAIAIQKRDAALFAAKYEPRVIRDRSGLLPSEWVAGDVHHLDSYVFRQDGSEAAPRFIAWFDFATNRLDGDLVLPEKNKGITRRHVLESFGRICADPSWGVMERLYLDLGTEYGWAKKLADDLLGLRRQVSRFNQRAKVRDWGDYIEADDGTPNRVQRSRVYNPQSKIIEGFFAILEELLMSRIPGYLGSDRTKKKTENLGRKPKPFPGTFEEFEGIFRDALKLYNWKRQRGSRLLKGDAPYERFKTLLDAKPELYVLDTTEMAVAFYDEETRQIHTGGEFNWKGGVYHHRDLRQFANLKRKFIIREPLIGDGRGLFVHDEKERRLCIATPKNAIDVRDIEGAKEQSRMSAEFRQDLREMKVDGKPRDAGQVFSRAVEAHGEIPKPEKAAKTVDIAKEAAASYAALPSPRGALPPSAREQREDEIEAAKFAILDKIGENLRRKREAGEAGAHRLDGNPNA